MPARTPDAFRGSDLTQGRSTPRLVAVVLIVTVALIVGLGAGIVLAGGTTSGIHLNGTVSGSISQVSGPGSKICLTPDGGGDEICGPILSAPGSTLTVGEHVTVVRTSVPTSFGSIDVLLVPSTVTSQ